MTFVQSLRAACVALVFALAAPALAQQPPSHPLRVEPLTIVTHNGRARFIVEVADDEGSREYGLMFPSTSRPTAACCSTSRPCRRSSSG